MTRAQRSTHKAAQQADLAADQLLDWLRQQRGSIPAGMADAAGPDAPLVTDQMPGDETALPSIDGAFDEKRKNKATPTISISGRDNSGNLQDTGFALEGSSTVSIPFNLRRVTSGGETLRLPHTDWLHHHLDVTGPAAAVTAFQAAASGAGTIPWPFERGRMEEDLFHLLVAPPVPQRRRLSLAGARVLARQLADAAELRHATAVARVGHSRACPFDLHALLPVPPGILPLGPDHPDSVAWLWAHWGTTEALRHVVREPALALRHKLSAGTATLRFSFWSADWTPWRALDAVAARWLALRFAVTPTYGLL